MKAKPLKKKSKTDWDKLHNMSDTDIDYSDIPPLDSEFFKKGELRMPKTKPLISSLSERCLSTAYSGMPANHLLIARLELNGPSTPSGGRIRLPCGTL